MPQQYVARHGFELILFQRDDQSERAFAQVPATNAARVYVISPNDRIGQNSHELTSRRINHPACTLFNSRRNEPEALLGSS